MATPKKIINDPKDAVEEFIQGLLYQYPNHFVRVKNHPVLLLAKTTTPTDTKSVRLLSGGGSGHEPSHAGWVGKGMLAGAICGGMFASPSVANVLAAIHSSSSLHGSSDDDVLLIVKNYTGDRLNFGLAAEQANSSSNSRVVRTVVVADDCALPRTKGITGARGVAGTVLIHKIAGAAAAAGKSLDDVVKIAQQTARRVGTLGIALKSVTVPGAKETNNRLQDDDNLMEIGLGIHGEAGLRQSPVLTADEMAKEMITTILEYGRVEDDTTDADHNKIVPFFEAGDQVCVLVNNLGGTSNFELSLLARSCVAQLEDTHKVTVSRVLVGSYMTSFDMHGASLSILNLAGAENTLLPYLDAPTTAPAWASVDTWNDGSTARPSMTYLPDPLVDNAAANSPATELPTLAIENFTARATAALEKATTALAAAEPLLTQYDTIVGDGDCGMTMQRGATAVAKLRDVSHPVPLFAAMADAVSASMGGTSGVLLELLLRNMSATLSRCSSSMSSADMAAAFQSGVDTVQLYGGARVGSRTMLDALVPAAEALVANPGSVAAAAAAARQGADGTADMPVASAGRSNYLSHETLVGTPDPGAIAVAIILESITEALNATTG